MLACVTTAPTLGATWMHREPTAISLVEIATPNIPVRSHRPISEKVIGSAQPPAMIVTAGFDPLRDEGRAYGDRLRGAGVDVVYREYPGQIHAFVSLTKAIPQGMAATLEIAEYVRRRLS